MGAFSIWHWLILLVVVLVLFGGKGKISSLMGDVGKGIKSFKKGIKDEIDANASDDSVKTINHEAEEVAVNVDDKSKASS